MIMNDLEIVIFRKGGTWMNSKDTIEDTFISLKAPLEELMFRQPIFLIWKAEKVV
jgi:hypothetical protein